MIHDTVLTDTITDKMARHILAMKDKRNKKRAHSAYMHRRFVAVDGEGLNVLTGPRKGEHDYVLLAISGAKPITRRNGLTTVECLHYLWANLTNKNVNVIFGGSYDFNSWLASIPPVMLSRAYSGAWTKIGTYTIQWRKGKYFSIRHMDRTVTIYDVIGFFQSSFIKACDDYLGEYDGRDTLVRDKARRGEFTWDEIKSIADYNGLELRLLESLCIELRERLDRADLKPSRWIGAGAVASSLMRQYDIRAHMSREIPSPVQTASDTAYSGGRFEPIQFGVHKLPAFEYDINSAYPDALIRVPDLAQGRWVRTRKAPENADVFGVYRVRWESIDPLDVYIPGPFAVRSPNGTISYPVRGETWAWTPEIANIPIYENTGFKFTIIDGWIFESHSDYKPFGFVTDLYEKRRVLKEAEDGAHVAYKLGINSLYGKTAQQVGFNKKTMEPPSFHQLEWAGYCTSWCRAKILRAAMQKPWAIVAFETDAVFTTERLNVPVSLSLGEFECTEFSSLTYVQSGHYYGTKISDQEVAKTRGVDRGQLTRADVECLMQAGRSLESVQVDLTRYVTAGIALAQDFSRWRRWETLRKHLALYPMGKRVPCDPGYNGGLQRTWCPISGGMSAKYPIEWRTPNPAMPLAALRDEPTEWDM